MTKRELSPLLEDQVQLWKLTKQLTATYNFNTRNFYIFSAACMWYTTFRKHTFCIVHFPLFHGQYEYLLLFLSFLLKIKAVLFSFFVVSNCLFYFKIHYLPPPVISTVKYHLSCGLEIFLLFNSYFYSIHFD